MAISVVQSAHGSRASSGTVTATLGSAPTAGNLLIAIVAKVKAGSPATDTPAHTGDTFARTISSVSSSTPRIEAYTATIQAGSTSTAVTVTTTASTGTALVVYEVSGLSTTSDGTTQGGTLGSSPAASGSLTTAHANDLLIGCDFAIAASSGALSYTAQSSPWTSDVNHSATSSLWGYTAFHQVLSATGTKSFTQTYSNTSGNVITYLLFALEDSQPPPANTVAPAVTGTATVGNSLACSTGTWTNYGTPVYTYQWQRDNHGGGTYSSIAGQVSNSYTLVDADDACAIRCVVTNTDVYGAVSANSGATSAVKEPTPANSVAPVISGSAYQGVTLSSTPGTWTGMGGYGPFYTYQWQRDNSGGGTYSDISGATATSYLLTSGELGDNVRLHVVANNTSTTAATATSNVLGLVAAPPATPSNTIAPVASGIVDIGLPLTVTTGTWSSVVDSYGYQWQRDTAYDGVFSNISGGTAVSYTVVDADAGNALRCTVTATNITGSASAHSNALRWEDFFLATQVEFGDTFYDLGTNATEDPQLISASVTRGRDTVLGQMSTGEANMTFTNTSGNLDPTNVDSPWYGKILPIVRCRLRRRFNGVSLWIFNGRVEEWQANWLPPSVQKMTVPASDAFETLSNQTIVSGVSTLTTALTGSNNDLLFTAVNAGEVGDDITVTYEVSGTGTSLDTSVNKATNGNAHFVATTPLRGRGVARLGLSGLGQIPSAPPSAITVSGTDITVTVATDGSGNPTSSATAVMNALNANAEVAALVTVSLAPANSGAGTVTAMAQTNLSGGKWPQELTGDRITRVLDEIGWPADLRAIDAGTLEVVSKGFSLQDNVSALQHMQNVADAEFGYVFVSADGLFTFHDAAHRTSSARSVTSQATFSDDGTGFSYTVITPSLSKDKIYNQVTVTSGSTAAVPQTVDDTYSQDGSGSAPTWATNIPNGGFGVRALPTRSTELANDSDALAQAQNLVDVYAYPRVRFDTITTLEPPSGTAPEHDYSDGIYGFGPFGGGSSSVSTHDAWVLSVLALEIGDRVTVRTTPPATTSTSQFDAYIEQITDDVTEDFPWSRTLLLTAISSISTGGGGGGGTSGAAMLNTLGGDLVLNDPTNGQIG